VIRANLATRPFYDERVVHLWLGLLAVVLALLTLSNVSRVVRTSRSDTRLSTEASQNEARAAELRESAARLRASVDPRRIETVSVEARQANELIDRRTFSWTEVLNLFETTLPDDVRITAVRPKMDSKRGFVLTISVVARGVDDVDEFMQKLEATGAFTELLTPEEHITDQGLLEASIEARYRAATGSGDTAGAKRP
jgi:Tfp pilus assembly protein PilN